ncbi:MAG: c-type cytochrome [Burkholderiales bacterium]|nr:c-type cytochrome [Burkholderiales bacterium]
MRGTALRFRCAAAFALVAALSADAVSAAGKADIGGSFPEFPGARLRQGRQIWLGTCKACHTTDIAGAPRVSDQAAWAPRLKKGMDALYASALRGRFGPMGTEMPPRGGSPELSDEQVRTAVDYMVAVVNHFAKEKIR